MLGKPPSTERERVYLDPCFSQAHSVSAGLLKFSVLPAQVSRDKMEIVLCHKGSFHRQGW
jgi:hypothetical protein